jgi:hypothetical protein
VNTDDTIKESLIQNAQGKMMDCFGRKGVP